MTSVYTKNQADISRHSKVIQFLAFFLKSDDTNRLNQPTSRKPIKMDNFYKNCPIWLRFGMQLSFTPLYHQEKFC